MEHTTRTKPNKSTDLFSFVIGGEGNVQLKAFCDSYKKKDGKLIRDTNKDCKRFSIGYGTISYQGETITKEEAHNRMESYLNNIGDKIPKCWTNNQKIAILDYQYQFGTYSKGINIYSNKCDYKSVKYILYPYNRYLKGVEKRRVRGFNLFTK